MRRSKPRISRRTRIFRMNSNLGAGTVLSAVSAQSAVHRFGRLSSFDFSKYFFDGKKCATFAGKVGLAELRAYGFPVISHRELAIEIGVRPDPIPDHRLSLFPRDRSIGSAHANCPGAGVAAQTLKRKARMGRFRTEKPERLACLRPYLDRERMVQVPEPLRRYGVHVKLSGSRVPVWPLRNSSRASLLAFESARRGRGS